MALKIVHAPRRTRTPKRNELRVSYAPLGSLAGNSRFDIRILITFQPGGLPSKSSSEPEGCSNLRICAREKKKMYQYLLYFQLACCAFNSSSITIRPLLLEAFVHVKRWWRTAPARNAIFYFLFPCLSSHVGQGDPYQTIRWSETGYVWPAKEMILSIVSAKHRILFTIFSGLESESD